MRDVAGLIVNGSEPLYKKVNEISRQEGAVHLCFTHINYSSELPAVCTVSQIRLMFRGHSKWFDH